MFNDLDKIDKAMWHRINEKQGCSIREAIRPFLLEKSESVLRDRVRALELRQLIRLERTKKEVQCYPVVKAVE
jgi:predicted transcriptional regulator